MLNCWNWIGPLLEENEGKENLDFNKFINF